MNTFTYQRQIPVEKEYDLVVAGGGPSGVSAAISAARLGASVLLVEATGALGGMGTQGLVANWYSLSDGVRVLTKGLFWEVLTRVGKAGGLAKGIDLGTFDTNRNAGLGFSAETLKRLLDEMCGEAGVDLLFCTRLVDADVAADGKRVKGVVVHHIEGLRYVPAKAFVDATGDAVLAQLCGAECKEAGRDTEHIMPPTLCGVVTNVEWDKFKVAYAREDELIAQGIREGAFSQADRHVPGLFRSVANYGIQNAGHLFGMDALRVRSLTAGYIKGRKLAEEYAAFYRKYFDGCQKLELVATGALMGVRESRRIVGESELVFEAFEKRRHFADQIGVYNKAVDVHVYDCSDEQWVRYTESYRKRDRCGIGESYGLPYGMMIPKGWENLWVAGRCVSADVKMHGAIRDQPACFIIGQAAGSAAVQAIRCGETAGGLDVGRLQETLRRGGVYLG